MALRLTQVLANLLNNAAKYTQPGGQIWVDVRREGSRVAVSVRDNGIGIPSTLLPKVFDLFTQLDQTHNRKQGGLGIGLTLVKRLVEMHGGEVEAHSAGPGRGSEFVVRLPLAGVPLTAPGLAPVAPGAVGQRRILVVDDNRDGADSLGMLLQIYGADVHVVHDGPAALDALTTYRPSAVVLDIGMPGMDGYELARRIREQVGAEVTLIALTGWGQEEDRRHSKEAGINYHLIKPVDCEELVGLLTTLSPNGS